MPFHPCGLQQREDRKYEEESVQNTLSLPTYISSDAVEGLEGKGVGKKLGERGQGHSLKVAVPEE